MASALALLLTLLVAPPATARDDGPIQDPIPDDPAPSGLGLVVKEVAQLPESTPTPPDMVVDPRLMRHNRINYLGEVPDGSGRLYVPDLNGKLYLLDKRTHRHKVYLDVGATFAPDFFSAQGLGEGFGFTTFHPEFKKNGKFYTVHVEWGPGLAAKTPDLTPQPNTAYHSVINEWTATDPDADAFQGTHREILRLGFGGRIHNIQQIDFNPNTRPGDADYGELYIAAGDGGTASASATGGDPQNLAVPQGKILRIDPSGNDSANGEYGIPDDNPFAGQPGKVGEIFAYGMRDPHRFSWDASPLGADPQSSNAVPEGQSASPQTPRASPEGRSQSGTNRMFLAHIGEHAIESIHDIEAGSNLGWSLREGAFRFDTADRCFLHPLPADDARFGYNYPVAAYDHDPPPGHPCTTDSGHAISGGFVYRGAHLPALRGKYLFTDIVDGRLFYTEERRMKRDVAGRDRAQIYTLQAYDTSGNPVTMRQLAGDDRVDLRFGSDGKGEPYLIAKANGKIWKVVGTRTFAGCETVPVRVTGATAPGDWAPVTPSKWEFSNGEVILAEAGVQRPGPRRPFEYAVLQKGPAVGSSRIDAQVRLDTPVPVSNRDVILVFGHRDDTHFYYAHLSSDNTIYPHNGIFVVNDADRLRIDQQWNGDRHVPHGAPPAITDAGWHDVRVQHCAGTGEIAVHVDGSPHPVMTAVDTTFGSGRVGFGSFDNIGRLRDLTLRGTGSRS